MSGSVRITGKIDVTIIYATANRGVGKNAAEPENSVIVPVGLGKLPAASS